MLTIHLDTARFHGAGMFTCTLCASRTPIQDLSGVLLSLPTATVLYDAPTGSILHDCRHIRMMDSVTHGR